MRSRLPAVVKVAGMVKRHIDNILTHYSHRITNAVSEGLNSAIQTIKKRAGGYRNDENFRMVIYFHCGGLDLYTFLLKSAKVTHAIPGCAVFVKCI